jgi:hypothetical protein
MSPGKQVYETYKELKIFPHKSQINLKIAEFICMHIKHALFYGNM